MIKLSRITALPLLLLCITCSRTATREDIMDPHAIVPYPASMELRKGEFVLSGDSAILASNDESVQRSAAMLAEFIRQAGGPALKTGRYDGTPSKGAIVLVLGGETAGSRAGAHSIEIGVDGAILSAPAPEGIFRGIQTLRQMLMAGKKDRNATAVLPCVSITDQPRFSWRGLNLDTSRHFYDKESIKRYLDLLALYKMNVFHWHLTDDQGWRLEIKKYPGLTETSAWRTEGGARYGGFYSQDDVREIVQYAKERFITVVPEIEMPGHCQAVLAAYPELSCTGGPFKVSTHWGIHQDVFCAGKEETFRFLENVLLEVIALFPGTYIHIGGDEVLKMRWKRCPQCQARIRDNKLKDEKELQSYFIRRIESFLTAHNRKIIGWDEILEGGLAPSATVQSWRGVEGAIEAVKQGHEAIVSTTEFTYFDYGLAVTSLEKVYALEPVPEGIGGESAKMILGSEANMWSEFATQDNVEGKLFPRILALSEVLWSPQGKSSFKDFHARLQTQYGILGRLGVRYGGESEPGFYRIGYFFRDVSVLIGMLREDPEAAWPTVKGYLGMGSE